jgi:hypothetical protein
MSEHVSPIFGLVGARGRSQRIPYSPSFHNSNMIFIQIWYSHADGQKQGLAIHLYSQNRKIRL